MDSTTDEKVPNKAIHRLLSPSILICNQSFGSLFQRDGQQESLAFESRDGWTAGRLGSKVKSLLSGIHHV